MSKHPKRILIATVICVILAGIFAYTIYDYLQYQNNKKLFTYLNADLDTFSNDLRQNNQGLVASRIDFCKHDVEEFGGGKLACYGALTIHSTNQKVIDTFAQILTDTLSRENSFTKTSFSPIDLSVNAPTVSHFVDARTGIDCEFMPVSTRVRAQQSNKDLATFICKKYVNRSVR
jgi:hypothetical protein